MTKQIQLLPVTYDSERFTMWADENFRRVVDAIGSLRAADLALDPNAPGTGGGYIFSDGLELYHASSTPYIDFHRAANAAGDSNADYNVRLINEANGYLVLYGGVFKSPGGLDVNGTLINGTNVRNYFKDTERSSGVGLRVGAAWGYYGIYSEDGDLVIGSTTGTVRLNNGGTYLDGNGWTVLSRNYMGLAGAFGGSYAQFSHSAFWNSAAYGYMQSNSGEVFISGPSAVAIHFRTDNNEKFYVDVNATGFRNRPVLNDNAIYTRGYGDEWHVHGWWSGNDGLRITEYGGLYFRVRDTDPALEILATGVSRFRRFDQIGAYDTSAIMTKSEGGGTGAKVGFWSAGQNAAQILKCWGSTIEGRSWDDGGWGTINAVLNNMSTRKGKGNIKDAKQKLTKAQRRTKHKNTRTVHYNRLAPPKGWCANCSGTGVFKKRIKPDSPEENVTCPYCHGDPMGLPAPAHHQKSEEQGWFGFIAEEIVEEFPEAVFYKEDFDGTPPYPVGLDSLALIAILWEDNKDQQEEIDSLETRVKALEKK